MFQLLYLLKFCYIAKKGRITISFEETITKIEENENFEISYLDLDILRIANKIIFDLEMHDKIIIATAIYHNVSLITKDGKIKSSGTIKTIW